MVVHPVESSYYVMYIQACLAVVWLYIQAFIAIVWMYIQASLAVVRL